MMSFLGSACSFGAKKACGNGCVFADFLQMAQTWCVQERFGLLTALAVLVVTALAVLVVRGLMIHLEKTSGKTMDALLIRSLERPLSFLIIVFGVVLALQGMDLPGDSEEWVFQVLYAAGILVIFWSFFRLLGAANGFLQERIQEEANGNLNLLVFGLVRKTVKTVLWVVAILFVARNVLQWDVTALITGAGVAGLAVAFAAQNTIANVFGAISLITDKAFKVGDRVKVAGADGLVESVGLRSTKLRSLDGTVWNMPNRVVADGSIENISMRPNIKYAFTIGLVYGTTPAKMREALAILHEILDNYPHFDQKNYPPKFCFSNFNTYSMDIGVIVWFDTQDFFASEGWKEEINFAILEKFAAAGLEMAFPTSTHYVVNQK